VWIFYRHLRGKTVSALVLAYYMLSPHIKIVNFSIDSLYLLLGIMFFNSVIENRGILRLKSPFRSYFSLLIFVYIIYTVALLIYNRENISTELYTFSSYTGCIKNILALQLTYWYDVGKKLEPADEAYRVVLITVFFNLFALILQLFWPVETSDLFRNTLSIQAFQQYASTTQYGDYNRYQGFFNYPMMLGSFALYGFTFLIYYDHEKGLKKNLILVLLISFGVLSGSKVFFIGIMIAILFAFGLNGVFMKSNYKRILPGMFILFVMAYVYFNLDIFLALARMISPGISYRMQFIRNLAGAFDNRYGEEGSLSYMADFLKSYWFIGVGPASIAGEGIYDASIAVLIHNGGLLALVTVLFWYVKNIVSEFKAKSATMILLLIIILIVGVGQDSWIVSSENQWIIWYMLLSRYISGERSGSHFKTIKPSLNKAFYQADRI
jgi:hypothetical protein